MNLIVHFPDGPRKVEAIVMGKAKLELGKPGAMLVIPRCVPGYRLSRRRGDGWQAVPEKQHFSLK